MNKIAASGNGIYIVIILALIAGGFFLFVYNGGVNNPFKNSNSNSASCISSVEFQLAIPHPINNIGFENINLNQYCTNRVTGSLKCTGTIQKLFSDVYPDSNLVCNGVCTSGSNQGTPIIKGDLWYINCYCTK